MFQPNTKIPPSSASLPLEQPKPLMQVSPSSSGIVVVKDGVQSTGYSQAESIVDFSKKLQDDLHRIGIKIKEYEDNIKVLNSQKAKLDDSILDVQVAVGKYHSENANKVENGDRSHRQTEENMIEEVLRHEKSAAGVLCQLKARHGAQASNLPMTKDVLGIVAMLGKVDDDNLSSVLSEYLGTETMLGIVCKTYDGLRALEVYDKDGSINKSTGLHGLGASIGRALEGRFLAISLENLRPYKGGFVLNDPQRRLDLIKPRLPNGEFPPGFLGYAVNMITVDTAHLFCTTPDGRGLRETLFYSLFSRLQVYETKSQMLSALPLISDGAVSLDGGMIKDTGVFSLGHCQDVDVKFPKSSVTSSKEVFIGSERQIQELKQKKENTIEEIRREQSSLDNVKIKFEKKKDEFLKFLSASSSYATQHQTYVAQSRMTQR